MIRLLQVLFLAVGVLTLGACNHDAAPAAETSSTPSAPPAKNDATTLPVANRAATGAMCGGLAGIQCADPGDYCHFTDGECVSVSDVAGTCTKRPQMCAKIYEPVCGCDGKTHGNSCDAAAAGVSIAASGECH